MSLFLLALAVITFPAPSRAALRLRPRAGPRRTRAPKPGPPDPFAAAATWDLLAAALRAGLPVAGAVRAVLPGVPPGPAERLREVVDLLALGADPVHAWARALDHPDTAPLARAARRTARSGAALAGAAADLAVQARAGVADQAEARAQRAAVLVAGPLALCFLPAFLCLGVVPVVIGLVGSVGHSW
ncbi:type II secretion system F family protein [Saccharothrix sp. HUAS TT1]|uniref:type II secretion system F family protein n=1 Tax=unclassified Saccharothrix TaxID=2593673 RepID=UPI00345C2EBB